MASNAQLQLILIFIIATSGLFAAVSTSKNETCGADEFTCKAHKGHSKMCIPKAWRCDGHLDCFDHSDEFNCTYKKDCARDQFKCANGACIYKEWVCDGREDCYDGSDEKLERCIVKCDPQKEFKCANSVGCIPKTWICDGEFDCKDHSDEMNCTEAAINSTHPYHKVQCRGEHETKCQTSGQCIHKDWKCDGEIDCLDGSDEENCGRRICTVQEFSCDGKKKCVELLKKCDGVQDCEDGTDESGCVEAPPKRQQCDNHTEYMCPDDVQHCISYEDLCVEDRANNDCVETVCNRRIEVCSGDDYCLCRMTPLRGSICHCPIGFKAEFGTCYDINECLKVGTCSQTCINLPGGHQCGCHEGFALLPHPRSPQLQSFCRAGGDEPTLLVANRQKIRRYSLTHKVYEPLIRKFESASTFDLHIRNETVVWFDMQQKSIRLCQLLKDERMMSSVDDCINQTVLADKDLHTVDGLAVDWLHYLVYFTDTGLDQISVIDINSKRRKTLITKDLDEPLSIAIDPLNGMIFWTEIGKSGKIGRAGMDGLDRMTLVSGDIAKRPMALSLDIHAERIYWVDAKAKLIMSCDYFGTDRLQILRSHIILKHPFSIVVFEDTVYWTDQSHDGVLTADKFTGEHQNTIMSGMAGTMTLRMFHKMVQPEKETDCLKNECQQLCLPRTLHGTGSYDKRPYTCECFDGYTVDKDDPRFCKEDGSKDTDEEAAAVASGPSGSLIFFYVFLGFVAVSGAIVLCALYRHRSKQINVIRFVNPSYNTTINDNVISNGTNEPNRNVVLNVDTDTSEPPIRLSTPIDQTITDSELFEIFRLQLREFIRLE